jgi:hypothetical protein
MVHAVVPASADAEPEPVDLCKGTQVTWCIMEWHLALVFRFN